MKIGILFSLMKIIYLLCIFLINVLLLGSCNSKQKDVPVPDETKSYRDKVVLYDLSFNSDTSWVTLKWSQLENDDFIGYDLYRTEVKDAIPDANEMQKSQYQFLTRVPATGKTSYIDVLPHGPFFKYVVVARTNDDANPYFVSNLKEVQVKNRNYVQKDMMDIFHNVAARQMIVFSKNAGTLSVYDYNCNLLKKATIPDKDPVTRPFCLGSMGTFNNRPELYIPSHGIIYIYDPETLDLIDSISTEIPYFYSVSSYKNLLFANGTVIDRGRKEAIQYSRNLNYFSYGAREFPLKNKNSNYINSFYISLSFGSSNFGVSYLNDDGRFVSRLGDLYYSDYPLNPRLCKAAPNGLYLITDTRGAIYDYSLKFQRYLSGNPTEKWQDAGPFSDFEFNDDGSLIYAGMNSEKSIKVYDSNYMILKSIPLIGYPLRIFRQNNELIVAIGERPLGALVVHEDLPHNLYRIRFQRVKL